MPKTIRSRSDKAIGQTLEDRWTIVGKRVIAPATPRTRFEPPRLGIFDYDVVPIGKSGPVNKSSDVTGPQPMVSFRRMK